jgi:MOSC domain-containing protein YiiM
VPKLVSVNVGTPQQLSVRRGRPMMSAIAKHPVDGRVRVEGVNVAGDAQADLRVHGGPDKAVYAYAREDSSWWEDVLGIDIPDGMFGENLTTEGVDVTNAVIGERWRIGTVELEVCQPRQPCSKLGLRFGNPKMVKLFAQSSRPGAYLRIVTEGELGAGDVVEVLSRPDHGVTIAMASDAVFKDRSLAARVLEAPQLSAETAADLRQAA